MTARVLVREEISDAGVDALELTLAELGADVERGVAVTRALEAYAEAAAV